MVRTNDSVAVIIGTLALLVGGVLAFSSGYPDEDSDWALYVVGIGLIVGGILIDAGIVVKTNEKINALEKRVKELEDKK